MRAAIVGATKIEVTPDEFAASIDEALDRVRPGPDGLCVKCRKGSDDLREDGARRDFRYGLCDECAFCRESDCLESPGESGYCGAHGTACK